MSALKSGGVPLDAPLRGHQFAVRGALKIPIHGGPGDPNGTFNAINVRGSLNAAGVYRDIPHGSSFVQVVSFNGTPCPDAATILTYSQSTNPNSPYFADQTQMFSNKEWVTDEFCDSQIRADPNLLVTAVSAATPLPAASAALPNSSRPRSAPLAVGLFLGVLVLAVAAAVTSRAQSSR